MKRRIGIYGWGLVGPKSPDIVAFEENLRSASSWLETFEGFGPSNFLVGNPQFDFDEYKGWIDERFEPRRFAQLEEKMGNVVKYAIGAFIQALGQNPGIEELLTELEDQAHVYIGTGLGDFAKQYDISIGYNRAQQRWNEFWCASEHHAELTEYRESDETGKKTIREKAGAPDDPDQMGPYEEGYFETREAWYRFWINSSEGLHNYLAELREIEGESVGDDIAGTVAHVIRRKMAARKKLTKKYGAPVEPWNSVDANLLWNIPNISAAQISMLGRITGPAFSPVAACSSFGNGLWMASNSINTGQAKAVVVGCSDPEPHPLSIGTFYNARVLSNDGKVSKPFTGLRGTHVAGGSCIWIVGDVEYMESKGMRPLGLELVGIGVTSDADHIITPSKEGVRAAISLALADAGITGEDLTTWDMHATATPGDWTELQNTIEIFPELHCLTARKGIFGHGMSVCGGWEMTAQHLGMVSGELPPTNLNDKTVHPQIREHAHRLVGKSGREISGEHAGKVNMGVGGINACVIGRKWD